MHAQSLTCNCRFCGYVISYGIDHVGEEIPCPRCSQKIRLPGKLASIATIQRARQKDTRGIAMEIGGFVLMFFLFPYGMIAGIALVYFGWKKSTALVCSNCGTVVKSREESKCPKCKLPFGLE